MPAPTPTVRSLILGTIGGALVATLLALPGSAAASDADRPGAASAAVVRQAAGAHRRGRHRQPGLPLRRRPHPGAGDPGGRAARDPERALARGRCGDGSGQHSLGQIAVGHSVDSSYLEAGWRQYTDGPASVRLLAAGRRQQHLLQLRLRLPPQGARRAPRPAADAGDRDHHRLPAHRQQVVAQDRRQADRLLPRPAVAAAGSRAPTSPSCTARSSPTGGSGSVPTWATASRPATRTRRTCATPAGSAVRPLKLHKATTVREVHDYGFRQTSDNSFRYGGPGAC